jgi:hypothetical protein
VALVEHLPERDLGVAGDIDVLRTIRDELHKTATHLIVCNLERDFFSGGGVRGERMSVGASSAAKK